MRRDLLASVALRWQWWRLRGATPERIAAALLSRNLRREERDWPAEGGRPDQTPGRGRTPADRLTRRSGTADADAGRMRVVPAEPVPGRPDRSAAELAGGAWIRARQVRRTRTAAAVVVLVSLSVLAVLSPRLIRGLPPADVGPTAVPTGVLVMPTYAQLITLPVRTAALPPSLDIGTDAVPLAPTTLRVKPPGAALALLKHADGPVYAFVADGTVRLVDNPELSTADTQLYSTALSPDGQRAVFPAKDGIYVLNLATATVRSIPTGGPPAGLSWRGPRTVVVPNFSTSLVIDVDAGTTAAIATSTGTDVVTQQGLAAIGGKPANPLVELLPANTSPKLRLWRTEPATTTNPVASNPAPGDIDDRGIFGPPWIGRWSGPGYSDADLIVRACGADTISLPTKYGAARTAIGAVATNGLYIATLVGTDSTTLELLGMIDEQTVLINATGANSSTLLAWAPRQALLQRVTSVSRSVVVAAADTTGQPAK
jgi:hypothetical protein